VLLALGLVGIVIYVIRPPGGTGATALNVKSIPAPTEESGLSERRGGEGMGQAVGGIVQRNRPSSQPVVALRNSDLAAGAATTGEPHDAGLASPAGERLLFVVATSDPVRANHRIAAFLQTHQIVSDAPMPLLNTLKTPAFAAKPVQITGDRLDLNSANAPQPTSAPSPQDSQTARDVPPAAAAKTKTDEAQLTWRQGYQQVMSPDNQERQQDLTTQASAAPVNQSTPDRLSAEVQRSSPSATAGEMKAPDQAAKEQKEETAKDTKAQEQATTQPWEMEAASAGLPPETDNREVYLARNMTPEQIDALRRSLADDAGQATVMLYDRPRVWPATTATRLAQSVALGAPATTQPLTMATTHSALMQAREELGKALADATTRPVDLNPQWPAQAATRPAQEATGGGATTAQATRDVVILVLKTDASTTQPITPPAGEAGPTIRPEQGQ